MNQKPTNWSKLKRSIKVEIQEEFKQGEEEEEEEKEGKKLLTVY